MTTCYNKIYITSDDKVCLNCVMNKGKCKTCRETQKFVYYKDVNISDILIVNSYDYSAGDRMVYYNEKIPCSSCYEYGKCKRCGNNNKVVSYSEIRKYSIFFPKTYEEYVIFCDTHKSIITKCDKVSCNMNTCKGMCYV